MAVREIKVTVICGDSKITHNTFISEYSNSEIVTKEIAETCAEIEQKRIQAEKESKCTQ